MKTHVIVGRFQTPTLTQGHKYLINKAFEDLPQGATPWHKNGKLVIVVGCSIINYRHRNPLTFEIVEGMIRKEYRGWKSLQLDILKINDNPSDELWSQNLDELLKDYPDVTLYCSRDSFRNYYTGNHLFKEVSEVPNVSATKIREMLVKVNKQRNTENFRRGVIHASVNQFPTAFPTVDIAVIKSGNIKSGDQILLGRKPGRTHWCFIGGFVDPTDESLENAAARELGEEVGGLVVTPMEYLCSKKINDFRYKNCKDGIISSLFLTYHLDGEPIAADDIEEAKFFSLADVDANRDKILTPFHHLLLDSVTNHLKNRVL